MASQNIELKLIENLCYHVKSWTVILIWKRLFESYIIYIENIVEIKMRYADSDKSFLKIKCWNQFKQLFNIAFVSELSHFLPFWGF